MTPLIHKIDTSTICQLFFIDIEDNGRMAGAIVAEGRHYVFDDGVNIPRTKTFLIQEIENKVLTLAS